jgi:hypothetical protein
MAFQRADWRVHRIGWALLLIFVASGALGIFSVGPLSGATAVSVGGRLAVEHERFLRNGAPARLTVRATPAPGDDQLHLVIGDSWPATFVIEDLEPQPFQTFSQGNDLHLLFSTPDAGATTIRFTVRPDRSGLVSGRVALAGGEGVRVTQLVYP